jgi:hypothetical protein
MPIDGNRNPVAKAVSSVGKIVYKAVPQSLKNKIDDVRYNYGNKPWFGNIGRGGKRKTRKPKKSNRKTRKNRK